MRVQTPNLMLKPVFPRDHRISNLLGLQVSGFSTYDRGWSLESQPRTVGLIVRVPNVSCAGVEAAVSLWHEYGPLAIPAGTAGRKVIFVDAQWRTETFQVKKQSATVAACGNAHAGLAACNWDGAERSRTFQVLAQLPGSIAVPVDIAAFGLDGSNVVTAMQKWDRVPFTSMPTVYFGQRQITRICSPFNEYVVVRCAPNEDPFSLDLPAASEAAYVAVGLSDPLTRRCVIVPSALVDADRCVHIAFESTSGTSAPLTGLAVARWAALNVHGLEHLRVSTAAVLSGGRVRQVELPAVYPTAQSCDRFTIEFPPLVAAVFPVCPQ